MNNEDRDELILFIKETIDCEGAYNCETEEVTLDSNGFDHVADEIAEYVLGMLEKNENNNLHRQKEDRSRRREYV